MWLYKCKKTPFLAEPQDLESSHDTSAHDKAHIKLMAMAVASSRLWLGFIGGRAAEVVFEVVL